LIADGDTVLLRKAYGMANYALGAPNTVATKFGIASLTKTFTAAAIVMLQEGGRLSFDDRLDKYLPDFPHGDKIKIRHLLGHSAGVANPDDAEVFFKQLTPDELIETFKRKPLEFEPGTKDHYSNAGYILLARVVEKVSGQPFEEFLRARIFLPLGMADTGTLDQARVIPNLACPYQPGPGPVGLENALSPNPSSEFGCGSLYSTCDDLYRWAKAVRSERLYKRTALKYPFGWGRRNQFGHRYIEQSGLIPGYMSHLIVYLDRPMTIVFLSNIQSGLFNRVEEDLTAIAFGGEAPKHAPAPQAVAIDPRLLAGYLGRYQGPWFKLRVIQVDGLLYARFDNSPGRSYLMPTGADELFMPASFGHFRATRKDEGQVSQLSVTWGDAGEPMQLRRIGGDG
jgi:CubicO group peptidase (beta-lactamase class C family)